jgi:glc operon protein GlcG
MNPVCHKTQSQSLEVTPMKALRLLAVAALLSFTTAIADDGPPQYGTPIDLETARKVMAGAQAKAKQENWPVAIAIVDNAGFLVLFERLDNTQLASVQIALEKAQTSALFRRPTKAFEDRLAEGGANLKLLRLPGGLPMEGGLPILVDGKVIGAIGVSGVTSTQDGEIAQAGLDALAGEE